MTVRYHTGQFPPADLKWDQLIPLIGPASAALARYDGVLSTIPNANLLMTPLITQEAVLSSKIEGTQTTLGEVLEFEVDESSIEDPTGLKHGDIREVLNYREAMWHAVEILKKVPLSQRIMKEAHQVLMSGVRGSRRDPGNYRKIQNWIGLEGADINTASYIPIPAGELPEAMSRWERFIHDDACGDHLVRLALLHVEFEAIHPFLDGNGRLSRMFVPLYLYQSGLLKTPMFYISAYFEQNRAEYYERLQAVSRDRAWTEWCLFFLQALREQAKDNRDRALAIQGLYNNMNRTIAELTRSQYAVHTVDFLFQRPVFKASDFYSTASIPTPTARRILKVLQDNDFFRIVRPGKGQRSATLAFKQLLNTTEGQNVF